MDSITNTLFSLGKDMGFLDPTNGMAHHHPIVQQFDPITFTFVFIQ